MGETREAAKTKCCATISGMWQSYGCPCMAKVVRDGKPYCGRHDPDRRKAKNAARKSEIASRSATYDVEIAERDGGRLLANFVGDLPFPLGEQRALILHRRELLAALSPKSESPVPSPRSTIEP